MKKLLIGAMALALATGAGAVDTNGKIKFTVKIPEILVLYHWDAAELDLTKNATAMQQIIESDMKAKADHDNSSFGMDSTEATINENPVIDANVPLNSTDLMTVKLENSWGVRSIIPTGKKVQLTITKLNDGKLCEAASTGIGATACTSVITVTEEKLALSGVATPASVIQFDPQFSPAKIGSITFKLNFSGLTKSGLHGPKVDGELFQLALAVAP